MARSTSERQQVLAHGPALLLRSLEDLERVQREVWELGRDLVLAGTSYAALGRQVGVSPQAARARWGRHVDAWRAEHGDVMPWEVDEWAGVDPAASDDELTMMRVLGAASDHG